MSTYSRALAVEGRNSRELANLAALQPAEIAETVALEKPANAHNALLALPKELAKEALGNLMPIQAAAICRSGLGAGSEFALLPLLSQDTAALAVLTDLATFRKVKQLQDPRPIEANSQDGETVKIPNYSGTAFIANRFSDGMTTDQVQAEIDERTVRVTTPTGQEAQIVIELDAERCKAVVETIARVRDMDTLVSLVETLGECEDENTVTLLIAFTLNSMNAGELENDNDWQEVVSTNLADHYGDAQNLCESMDSLAIELLIVEANIAMMKQTFAAEALEGSNALHDASVDDILAALNI